METITTYLSNRISAGCTKIFIGSSGPGDNIERVCFVQDPDGTWHKASGDECSDVIGTGGGN